MESQFRYVESISDRQVIETLESRQLNDDERSLILGSLSLAKGTVAYWNAQDDIFDGTLLNAVTEDSGQMLEDLLLVLQVPSFTTTTTAAVVTLILSSAGTSVGALRLHFARRRRRRGISQPYAQFL